MTSPSANPSQYVLGNTSSTGNASSSATADHISGESSRSTVASSQRANRSTNARGYQPSRWWRLGALDPDTRLRCLDAIEAHAMSVLMIAHP